MTRTWKGIGAICLGTVVTAAGQAFGQAAVERPTTQPARSGAVDPAQQPNTRQPNSGQIAVTGANAQQTDEKLNKKIAVCLTLGNQAEIALAQLAEQRSQNPQVKQFAQHMIEQHRQALSKIQQAAPETAQLQLNVQGNAATESLSATADATGIRRVAAEEPLNSRTATGAAATGTAATGNPAAGQSDRSVQMAQKIAQECLKLTQQELSQKEGVEFDKAYMGCQVAAHLHMLGELRGSKEFATGQLQQVIAEGEQMAQQHLQQAKQIMAQLKDREPGESPQTSQRPATTDGVAR